MCKSEQSASSRNSLRHNLQLIWYVSPKMEQLLWYQQP